MIECKVNIMVTKKYYLIKEVFWLIFKMGQKKIHIEVF